MACHHYPHYSSQFGDTTSTKVFVGGLAWKTPTEEMRKYFEQFGHILEAVIINDKHTGKSKGYGFVTFRDPVSARKACADPRPMIYGRRANCNIASLGRPPPRPSLSPPGANISVRDGGKEVTGRETPAYNTIPAAPPSLVYSVVYSYPTYTVDNYGYHQGMMSNTQIQQPQYYHQQVYGQSYPYYYGYSVQTPRSTFFTPHQVDRFPSASGAPIHTTLPLRKAIVILCPFCPLLIL